MDDGLLYAVMSFLYNYRSSFLQVWVIILYKMQNEWVPIFITKNVYLYNYEYLKVLILYNT